MKNRIMNYPWGSHTAIAQLLGEKSPSEKPQAELWMGAHPKAPSMVYVEDAWISLLDAISENPEGILGTASAKVHRNRLPFLLKVLAAAKPLSIQAHPSSKQAKVGFERENRLGIALDAPHRNYRDDNPKPELLVAMSPFWALCGFRKIPEIIKLGNRFVPGTLQKELRDLQKQPNPSGLKTFFVAVMTLDEPRRKKFIHEVLSTAIPEADHDPVAGWMVALARSYPNDIGVLSPVFLNLMCLAPGEGIFLPAGVLHAYLEGVGVELMANSDNVLRGGLTEKHTDPEALIDVLEFEGYETAIIRPVSFRSFEWRFETPVKAFSLSLLEIFNESPYRRDERDGVEILLCMKGSGLITDLKKRKNIPFRQGDSFFVPASVPGYRVEGQALLYKASLPAS